MRRLVALVLPLAALTARAQPWQHPVLSHPAPGITAEYPLNTTGHSTWGTARTPTIACDFTSYAGGTTHVCSGSLGGTLTKQGTVNGGVATPLYLSGFGGANATGAAFPTGAGNNLRFPSSSAPGGDFTLLAVSRKSATAQHAIVGREGGSGAGCGTTKRGWVLYHHSGGAIALLVSSDGDNLSAVNSATVDVGTWHVIAGSFDFVTSGTSVLRLNVDGTDVSPTTNAVGPVTPCANAMFSVGSTDVTGSGASTVDVQNFWYIDGYAGTQAELKQWALAQMALMSSAGLQGSLIRTTTVTNAIGSCFHTMPAGAGAINASGLEVYRQATNTILRDTQICGGADWSDINTGGTTPCAGSGGADTTAGPDCAGTVDGDTIHDDSATGWEGRLNVGGCGTTTGIYTLSCYLKAGTLTTAALRITTDGTGSTTCELSGLDGTWQRKHCTTTVGGTPTTVDGRVGPGRYGTVADTGTVIVDHCDCIALDQPHPHACTAGSAVQINLTNASVSVAGGILNDYEGCAAATVTLPSTWAFDASNNRILGATGNATLLHLGNAPATAIGIYDGTTNQTTVGLTSLVGRSARLRANWSAARGKMCVEEIGVSACTEGNYDGTLLGAGTTVYLGSNGGTSAALDGAVKNVVFGTRWGVCQ